MSTLIDIKKIKNILIVGILGVVAFWIGLYAFRTQKPATPIPKVSESSNEPGHVGLQEINFVQVKNGIKFLELKAEKVEYQKAKNVVTFKKVTVTYFIKGDQPVRLVGNMGKLDTETKNIFVDGEVVIYMPESYELKVPFLYYRDDTREIFSEGTVSFKGPEILLEGQGLVYNLESQKILVKNKVRMTLYHSFLKLREGRT